MQRGAEVRRPRRLDAAEFGRGDARSLEQRGERRRRGIDGACGQVLAVSVERPYDAHVRRARFDRRACERGQRRARRTRGCGRAPRVRKRPQRGRRHRNGVTALVSQLDCHTRPKRKYRYLRVRRPAAHPRHWTTH